MGIKERIMKLEWVKNDVLVRKFGKNIHDMDFGETIKTGVEDRLMQARELNVPYCVVFGCLQPSGTSWDPYGNGDWNPPRDYITTYDIATEENDREEERQNVYAFLRGEILEKKKGNRK